MQRRAELCRQALALIRREDDPRRWAGLNFELGLCSAQPAGGPEIEDIEAAIEGFDQALKVYTQRDYAEEWGLTRRNLANLHYHAGRLYTERAELTGASDQEQAIQHYQAALEIWTPKTDPQRWAQAKHDLGAACFHRIQGNRAQDLERAIGCYQAALTMRTRDTYPAQHAQTLHNLGVAYVERFRDNRAKNVERAIELLGAALEIPEHALDPAREAKTRSNLASAYLRRIRGERADNVERAIDSYRNALAVQERAGPREEWATTGHNLAVAYAERPLGEPESNLAEAIAHLDRALDGFARGTFRWATVNNDLADVSWTLGNALRRSRPEAATAHFEQALDHGQTAAGVFAERGFPRKWALAQHTLGNICCDRIKGERAENLEAGIHHYRAALTVRTPEDYPFEWAQTQNNLGTAYWEREKGDRQENLVEAVACFERALGVHTPQTFPIDARRAARNLGRLHSDREAWTQARAAYAIALRAAEVLYRAAYSPGGKEAELAENTALYEGMLRVCLEEPDLAAALEAAEGGKARTFLDQMGQGVFPPPPGLAPDMLQQEAALMDTLRGQEQALVTLSGQGRGASEARAPAAGGRQIIQDREAALGALEAVWDTMATACPEAVDYVAMRRGEPVRWADIQALMRRLGPGAALVEFYTLPDRVVAFILRAGWETPRLVRAPVSGRQLTTYVTRFFEEVAGFPDYAGDQQTWQELADPLLRGVMRHLKGVDLVYLVPQGSLHYLPLHALEIDGAPLVEHFPVAYTPSAAVLARVLAGTGAPGANGSRPALVIGNPTGDLSHAEDEARGVAGFLGAAPYLGQAATRARVLAEIKQVRVAHLACHAEFDSAQPLHSGLALSDGTLTAQQILKLRLDVELVVLSACQTAQQQVGRGDELMGLLRVLLYAGASSLVASLWPADDQSTGRLMRHFYATLYGDGPAPRPNRAHALREAMLEVRRQPGWEHPYYWAPFILVAAV